MKRHVSVGVIGHVDHGKTSLVKALSGIDTDRLKEEKERGMSIVLGFAYLAFEEGIVDLIDVPGHEHFVRTMVSGATGIEAAMLVIDVNEGVKPQTTEHLAITGLLGMRRGIVVLAKSDRADNSERAATLSRMRRLLKNTYLELAPIIFSSVLSGEGLAEVKAALRSLLTMPAPTSSATTQFYLPVDRAFSMPGRGTVVTGTLRRGTMQVGDEVDIMPAGVRATVRQLEWHNGQVERAIAGQRVGVNLRHVRASEIARGDTLASVGLLQPWELLDVDLCLLARLDKPVTDGQAVRLLFGTNDVPARVRLLGCVQLDPGQRALAQLRTGRPVACAAGEPFIIRRESPAMTIGGGRILDPVPTRHRRFDAAALARLAVVARGETDDAKVERIKSAGYVGLSLSSLIDREDDSLPASLTKVCVIVSEKVVLYRPLLASLGDMVVASIEKFHARSPTKRGAPIAYCRSSLPRTVADATFKFVLHTLSAARRIVVGDGLACRYGYDPRATLSDDDRKIAAAIESGIRSGGTMPPDVAHLVQPMAGEDPQRRQRLLYLLIDVGCVMLFDGQLSGQRIVFHTDALAHARRAMHRAYAPSTRFTVADVRVLLGSSRKFIVPLLEHFDAIGYTRRQGDHRVLIQHEQGGE